MTLTRFIAYISSMCVLMLCSPAQLVWAQGVQPYPNAITNRNFYPKSPMKPPAINTPFADPDFGTMIVRVTDQNTNPQIAGSFFRNPSEAANEWSMNNRKFYVMGADAIPLAFAFHPARMTVGALAGAGAGGALILPLNAGPTFSFVDPDLIYGTEPRNSLTITTYRFSTGVVQPILDSTTCNTQPPLAGSSTDITLSKDDKRIEISAGGNEFGVRPFVIVYDQRLGCRWYNTQTGQVGGQWGPTGQVNIPDRYLINHSQISGNGQYVRIGSIEPSPGGFYVWDVTSLNVQACHYYKDVQALHLEPWTVGQLSSGVRNNVQRGWRYAGETTLRR